MGCDPLASKPTGLGSLNPISRSAELMCLGASQQSTEHLDGTAKRRNTKHGGMNDRKSEQPIVPLKRGNQLKGPSGGKGLSEHGTDGGTDYGYIEVR
jgi:hypothetical protein